MLNTLMETMPHYATAYFARFQGNPGSYDSNIQNAVLDVEKSGLSFLPQAYFLALIKTKGFDEQAHDFLLRKDNQEQILKERDLDFLLDIARATPEEKDFVMQ